MYFNNSNIIKLIMLYKKNIHLKKKPNQAFFAKFKKDFLFYPTNSIEMINENKIKIAGRLHFNPYKITSNLFFDGFNNPLCFLSIGCTKRLQSLINCPIRLYIINNKIENKDEQREMLMFIKKIHFISKKKDNDFSKLSILVIFPNQTTFVQLIRTFFCIKKKKFKSFLKKKTFKNILSKTSLKLKYGKLIMPSDNRSYFQDGNVDQFDIYGIILNKTIKISKSYLNSNISFTTPLTLIRTNEIATRFNNISFYWIDSVEMILMQNPENFLFIIKNLIEIRMNLIYTNHGMLKEYKKNKLIFKIFIISSLLPDFMIRLFFSLSFSSYSLSKNLENLKTYGILIFPRFFFNNTELDCGKPSSFYFLQFLKTNFQNFLLNKKHFNLLIFVKNYSELIPIRNSLQKLKKKMNFKINVFSEYLENKKKKPLKPDSIKEKNNITLMTERYFFYFRYLYIQFDSIYFHTYPFNKEFYYEIVKQIHG